MGDKIVFVVYDARTGQPAMFHMAFKAAYVHELVLHLGLVMVLPEHQGKHLQRVCLYNMMSETQLVKRAMFFKLADEFAPAVFLTFLYFVFILATRFYRLGLVYQNYPPLQIWNESAFTGLYIFTKIVQVMYYSTVVWSMQKLLASPELFRSSQSSFHSVYPANN